jgi:hypothetical protein
MFGPIAKAANTFRPGVAVFARYGVYASGTVV